MTQRYAHNADEVNQVAVNAAGTFLAAADDAGEVAIIELKTHNRRKRLRGGHSNLCSSVAFRADHPWQCAGSYRLPSECHEALGLTQY